MYWLVTRKGFPIPHVLHKIIQKVWPRRPTVLKIRQILPDRLHIDRIFQTDLAQLPSQILQRTLSNVAAHKDDVLLLLLPKSCLSDINWHFHEEILQDMKVCKRGLMNMARTRAKSSSCAHVSREMARL